VGKNIQEDPKRKLLAITLLLLS